MEPLSHTHSENDSRSKSNSAKGPSLVTQSPPSLSALLSRFQSWLHIPDTGAIEVVLGAYAANRLPGDPVWTLVIGPPSGGKGETLNPLADLPHIYSAATLTEAALLSGVKKADQSDDASGGLLREMGDFGILLMKDFTSVISMSREARKGVLAALREVYDGSWTRRLGVDGGRSLSWLGKMGLIGGVTQAIDSCHGVMGEMGPRFLLYRLPRVDGRAQADAALSNGGKEAEMRAKLQGAVHTFFVELDLDTLPSRKTRESLSDEDRTQIVFMGKLVACARSAVERDNYTRAILLVPDPEPPARLVRSAAQLLYGLEAIGVPQQRRCELVAKTLLDCIPPVRRAVLNYLAGVGSNNEAISETVSILESVGLPKQTVYTALQDLKCHGVVQQTADGWKIADEFICSALIAYPNAVFRPAVLTARHGFGDE